MENPNTLFLIAQHGLIARSEKGILESHMWNLNDSQQSMKSLSLHKSKADRAHKGGEIIDFRDATEQEIDTHQKLLAENGKDLMQDTIGRKIVVFRLDPKWNKMWSQKARSHQMAYKGIGYVPTNA